MDRVEVSPLASRHTGLAGFVVSGRWPQSTPEWAQFLALAVRMAAVPGLLPTSTIFSATDTVPDAPMPQAVGTVISSGPVLGAGSLSPGSLSRPAPSAVVVLHPPGANVTSTPEIPEVAAGCVFLPGLPHLGLEHRAAWVEADRDGTITKLISKTGVEPDSDVDTAVLAMLVVSS